MSEQVTHNASVALYKYMCQNIVGTDDQVRTLRMMNNIRDSLQSDNVCEVITSGSFGEGLEMRGSDLDIMIAVKWATVCEGTTIHFNPEVTTYLTMETEDTHPGFTKLRLVHTYDRRVFKSCDEIGSDYYFSNSSFRERITNTILPTVHGPCLSDKYGLFDLAFCLRSKSWITSAKQWLTRSNNSWPEYNVKQSIARHGVLFVPVGVKGSIQEKLEWRISFSVGEKMLMYSLTHSQLLCYALLKILLKDVISLALDVKDLLCSYFMKTVMFWISEESSTSIWKPENLISCFMRCFRRLIYYIEYSMCPHYFIPENNLFENKIKGQSQQILLNTLHVLTSYGWQCILFSGQISNFDSITNNIREEPRCLHVRNVEALLFSNIHVLDKMLYNKFILENGIYRVLSINSSKIKSLFAYYISRYCYRSHRLLQSDDKFDNKYTYKQYNTSISKFLLGTRHDAVSGWLLLASFFYRTNEYKKAVDILQYCLLKCTPEKLCERMNLSHIHKELFNLHFFRKMTIVQLLKFLHLDHVIFSSNSVLVPDEIRIEGEHNERFISPVVFTHFLRFLCHYHLNNTKQCRDFLQDLQLTIEENYFIANSLLKAISYSILGKTFQLIGDIESARRAFMQSFELYTYIMQIMRPGD
ncbi:uncharacterized protein LOC127714792 [Mytilus californianus]|uniref:uncharacterized protein LOC127714792 n=1 Tax=Mytilus californianus TaxID=6549 RepID=UPI0022451CC0|nr:uncharacterized protein LOC127714792 [Mytilus californianus]